MKTLLYFTLVVLLAFLLVFPGCKKDEIPTLTTADITDVTATTAKCGGDITDGGGSDVVARGVVWHTEASPTLENKTGLTSDGTGKGSFTSSVTNLIANTTYYIRAYATNGSGTAYGKTLTFQTSNNTNLPSVTTAIVTNIKMFSAIIGGEVVAEGGTPVIERGLCWSTNQNPTISDSYTIEGSGIGTFSREITSLQSNTPYFVRAYATNGAGIAYGNQQTFTTDCCPATVTDYNGNVYNTIMIGNQCWMQENLRVRNYANGTAIPNVTSNSAWIANGPAGARCWFDNDSAKYANTYGALYSFHTVANSNGLCPNGWHVPTDADWMEMEKFLGMSQAQASQKGWRGTDEGGKLKETDTLIFWMWPNLGATNSSGFTALPGGSRSNQGIFYDEDLRYYGCFWTSTVETDGDPLFRSLSYVNKQINRGGDLMSQKTGFSVRCVK